MSEAKKLQIVGTFNPKEVSADKIVFPEGLNTTYAIGNVKLDNGMGTLVKPGGTLEDFFNVFMDEKNPTITKPYIDLIFGDAGSYEVGTYVPIKYNARFFSGSYSYGPATGVTVVPDTWLVSDTEGNESNSNRNGFGDFTYQVTDTSNYKITAKVEHTESTSNPLTNIGNEYPAGKIKADIVTKESNPITGYRASFYGVFYDKPEMNSGTIRELADYGGISTKALNDGSTFTIDVKMGSRLVVIAYPDDLRDLTKVIDVSLGYNIADSFTKQFVYVEGANGYEAKRYKVFTLPFAYLYPNDNTFNVTI